MQSARQSTTPVQFNRMMRVDEGALMSSGEPGVVTPVGMIPLLRGDTCSGNFAIDVRLAEMPRPLLNGVMCNIQAWFVPKLAHAQFSAYDEFQAAYTGTQIETLGDAARDPKAFFNVVSVADTETEETDQIAHTLGIHTPAIDGNRTYHDDLYDAFALIYNFRLAAHSNKLPRRKYYREDATEARTLPPAFWPTGNRTGIVADYERALVIGALDLDVSAGEVPVYGKQALRPDLTALQGYLGASGMNRLDPPGNMGGGYGTTNGPHRFLDVWADMEGQQITSSLANIDKARELQSFANLRVAMQGNDTTGFNNDDAIMAELMQGFRVPETEFNRPWLLDSARVPFGMTERPATDGASLDQSVTTGQASATLRLNVPQQDVGGVIIITCEVMPERIDEAMSDEWMKLGAVEELPDALRDVLRPEPVDTVPNRRIDARHADPDGMYGFEPMNNRWNRRYTRLGGAFYQDDPANAWTEQRSAIWQANVVDPDYTEDHFLTPVPFPKYVFSDTTAAAFEFVARHNVTISGLTQIGDVLHENNDDYAAIAGDQPTEEVQSDEG